MSGMAKQYNANVAAGQQQEAEMDKLEYEYGLRSAIENASNVAAMARKEKEIASEEQQKKLERENKIKVQQQIGIENRETEKLKARLDGQNTGTSYQYPDPNNPDKMIGARLPDFYKDKGPGETTQARLLWYEQNGAKTLQDLVDNNQTALANKFRSDAARALISEALSEKNVFPDEFGVKTAYMDISSQYPNFMSTLMQDETINQMVGDALPALRKRLMTLSGYPDNLTFDVETEKIVVNVDGEQRTGIAVDTPPAYFFTDYQVSAENFRDDLFQPVYNIKQVGGGDLNNFYVLAESVNPDNPQQFVEKFVEVDNLYKPSENGSLYTPTIREENRQRVANTLQSLRGESVSTDKRIVGGPKVLKDVFTDMALNDVIDAGNMLPLSTVSQVDDKTFKNATGQSSAEFLSEAKASSRVVRLTEGVMVSVARGGQAGITGSLILGLAGIKAQAEAFVEVGEEILQVVSGLGYEEQDGVGARIREQNFTEIRRINKLLKQGNISAIDDTAMLRYYSMLLAYSMAVAVQGGDAAARTVSDQDVQRVADGAAPGAPGSKGRAFVSPEEILTVTANVRAEFGERAAIAELYASKNPTKMRAAHYYNTTFKDRALVFNDLVPNSLKVALIKAGIPLSGTEDLAPASNAVTPSGSAAQKFRMRVQGNSGATDTTNQTPAGRPDDLQIQIEEPTQPR